MIVWLAAVGGGLGAVQKYASAPGVVGAVPDSWPADTTLSREATLPTLIMFAHPQCPCTRASIGELAELLTRCHGSAKVHVLFLSPVGFGNDWVRSDLWRAADRIPGVEVSCDPEGLESRRFGAATSGHVVLYGADGQLLFSGGITGQRGHAGGNAGLAAIRSILLGGIANPESAVYGCPLPTPGRNCCVGEVD